MQMEHEFTVPVSVEKAWDVLLDVERLAPCMPGAVLDEVRGDEFDGRVKVKVGPITVTYGGTASFVEKDVENRKLVIKANGKEAKGAGTAAATITAVLKGSGEETQVVVSTDLAITGRPAQFGRGVMVDVSNKLLGKFTDCLSEQISGGGAEAAPAATSPAPRATAGSNGSSAAPSKPVTRSEPEAIDLFDAAGAPVLKRLAPLAGLVVLVLLVLGIKRRRR
ncbi:MAG TPA: SRPBCC family protein [Sporichthyaceae bacterium]|jgi:carbon monoxide dehydrogenase subunit G|nr:SRPBCC family protein [Sporichthyaceae bacterium]